MQDVPWGVAKSAVANVALGRATPALELERITTRTDKGPRIMRAAAMESKILADGVKFSVSRDSNSCSILILVTIMSFITTTIIRLSTNWQLHPQYPRIYKRGVAQRWLCQEDCGRYMLAFRKEEALPSE
eukprot:1689008-Amphidinium_carterae.1